MGWHEAVYTLYNLAILKKDAHGAFRTVWRIGADEMWAGEHMQENVVLLTL